MRKIRLTRIRATNHYTLGVIELGHSSSHKLWTLERPWQNNKQRVSCIPCGEYLCNYVPGDAPDRKFTDVYELVDVPNRYAILIHPGNKVKDSLGCIMPGLVLGWSDNNITAPVAVWRSRLALAELHKHTKRKPFVLDIQDITLQTYLK